MANIINSRVILRNDTLESWNNSAKKLLKGEMALALHTEGEFNGKYEIRIGDGVNAFSALAPTNIVIPYAAISGMPAAAEYELSVNGLSACLVKDNEQAGEVFSVQALSDAITAVADSISNATSGLAHSVESLSTALTAPNNGLCARVDALENSTVRGVNFVGHVSAMTSGDNATYTLTGETSATPAATGNLVIKDGVEYIFSDTSKKWEQFGDEGNTATTAYVDNKILSVTNTYKSAAHLSLLPTTDNVVGDVAVVSAEIGESTGKYQHTAYYWNGTAWAAMDGNYGAENVYFSDNIIMTYAFGKYNASDTNNITLSSKGKSLQAVMADALADVKQPSLTAPSITIACAGGTGEIGSQYTVADATLTFNAGQYQYAPTATNISVNVGNSKLSSNAGTGGAANSVQNVSVLVNGSTYKLDNTLTARYLSSGATYSVSANATYTAAPEAPKTNIGTDSEVAAISSDTATATKTATYTGYYPAYYGFSTAPTATPTAVTANNANTLTASANLILTRELNSFARTSFKADAGWYELFYLVPTAKQSKTSWSGKDSNNVDLAAEASTTATVTFLDGSTATYRVFIVRNAAQYAATTCTMKFA